jgi:Holliday junction resolvasome RuvABC ATP-dependent DNA helicase subunit
MAGPTRFAPILSVCKSIVDACEDEKVYHIILIITDGEIHDMRETVEEIAEMALENMPVSIVIVGVGNEDFSSMVRLDGDDLAIKENVKDIV